MDPELPKSGPGPLINLRRPYNDQTPNGGGDPIPLVGDYNKVIAYKRATWTLAAYFRTGYLYELFSKALLNAPLGEQVKAETPGGTKKYVVQKLVG